MDKDDKKTFKRIVQGVSGFQKGLQAFNDTIEEQYELQRKDKNRFDLIDKRTQELVADSDAAKFCHTMKEVNENLLSPLLSVVALFETALSIKQDVCDETTSNTAEKLACSVGGLAVARQGAAIGDAVGTLIKPGMGNIVGSFIGATLGGTLGALESAAQAENAYDYDVVEKRCGLCFQRFKVHRNNSYYGNVRYCPECM